MKLWTAAAACLLAVSISGCAAFAPRAERAEPTPPEPARAEAVAVSAAPKPAAPKKAPAASSVSAAAPQVTFASPKLTLGEALVLHVSGAERATAKTELPHQPVFYPDGEGLTALLPVAYTTALGDYGLTVQADETVFHYTISVQDREFVVQNLTMDDSTENSVNTNAANLEWEQKIEPLKLTAEPRRYWQGKFVQPATGEITTEYGTIRYTNGSKNATRHGGIDIAAKRGSQAVAANAGKIQFAEFIQLTGNTVVIEHGFGLKSFYYHMDALDVKTGDIVEKGDPIGKVGSTGYSTGPHLHYALLVNNIFINPWTAFDQGME